MTPSKTVGHSIQSNCFNTYLPVSVIVATSQRFWSETNIEGNHFEDPYDKESKQALPAIV